MVLPSAAKQKIATANGILPEMTPRAAMASHVYAIPFYVPCAFLMQETNGGHNIYGHDVRLVGTTKVPQPFYGFGEVTQANYAIYKIERDRLLNEPGYGYRRSQGVGPMQLTYWSIQDAADGAGGCWQPWANISIGMKFIRDYYKAARAAGMNDTQAWHRAALKWNGQESYAVAMDKLFTKWKTLVG